MTDHTPTTEAGRLLVSIDPLRKPHVLAIEAEARASGYDEGYDIAAAHAIAAFDRGRADALREAAERVRALPYGYTSDPKVRLSQVLAILTETER